MSVETRACQNCKNQFIIEQEDFTFYERIKVPAPTWCPECRQRRRYAWRNERTLYRRKCDLCGKSTVTIYSENKPYKVYCPPCWWSDKWDPLEYGQQFDFSRPFFEQFQELQLKVPRIALLTKNSIDSEYTNHGGDNKNCYLSFSIFSSENVFYSTNVWNGSRDCMECYRIEGMNERLYECVDIHQSYQCQYGRLLRACANCFYCYDCRNCQDCFLSSNLRGRQYYFLNQPYIKEDYFKKIKEFNLGSFRERQNLYKQFIELINSKTLHRYAVIEQSNNVSGNMIFNSRNARHCFEASATENTKYSIICPDVKETMDGYHYGLQCELNYEVHAIVHSYDVLFTHLSYDNSHISYCDSCHNSENLFGCVGLKQGRYSILNRSYPEVEYKNLKERIIEHMDKTGEYGQFFPAKLSPFGYNETQGQIYMPLTKEEAPRFGCKWEDRVPGTFGKETIKPEDIPDDIGEVQDSILKEALACTNCKKNYNIVQPELAFYQRENIPVPHLCPTCRYLQKIALRPPRKLWHRQCLCDYNVHQNTVKHPHHPEGRCPNEFETSYSPERKEIVYCEQCYNAEVV